MSTYVVNRKRKKQLCYLEVLGGDLCGGFNGGQTILFLNVVSEFLLMSQNGQNYIKDIKFSAFPFGEYNITVIVYRYCVHFHS